MTLIGILWDNIILKDKAYMNFDIKELLLGYTHGYPNLILAIIAGVLGLAILVGIGLLISILVGC